MIKFLLLIFSIAMYLVGTAHAEVYRSVDESGNTVFTDKPQKNSEKVDLPGLTTYESPPYKKIKAVKTKEPVMDFTSYSEFKILSPANKETIRYTDGNITVRLLVTPELQVRLGHRIILSLDGKEVTNTTVLTKVERGTHTLFAQIVDNNNRVLSEKKSTVFYVQRTTKGAKKTPGSTPDYKPKPSPGYKP